MNTDEVVADLCEVTDCLLAIGHQVESMSGNMFGDLVVDIAAELNESMDVLTSVIEIVEAHLRGEDGEPKRASATSPQPPAGPQPSSRNSAELTQSAAKNVITETMTTRVPTAGWTASPAQIRQFLCESLAQSPTTASTSPNPRKRSR